MRKELVDQLTSKYPKLLRNMYGDPRKTCLAFGIECGDGWYKILDDLCKAIQAAVDYKNRRGEDPHNDVIVDQIKEKFGGLRFYYSGGDDVIFKLVEEAEILSYQTCERCGAEGKERSGGWIRTLCDKCDGSGTNG